MEMLKLMDKKMFSIIGSKIVFIQTYALFFGSVWLPQDTTGYRRIPWYGLFLMQFSILLHGKVIL